MLKKLFTVLALFIGSTFCCAEELHFNNEVYTLKYSAIAPKTGGYGNEYFKKYENISSWTKMIGIYYYPEESSPLKFVEEFDKIVENTDNSVLLKIVENKKSDKAVISFLVNGSENAKKYFEHDIYKFEKHPTKGMVAVKYAVKHYFTNNNEINKIANEVKAENDKYLEMLISSSIPPVVERDIKLNN